MFISFGHQKEIPHVDILCMYEFILFWGVLSEIFFSHLNEFKLILVLLLF